MPKTNPFDSAPYVAPWYFEKQKPGLMADDNTFSWELIDTIGEKFVQAISLNNGNNSMGLVKSYTYMHPSPAGDYFCIWTPEYGTIDDHTALIINLYKTQDLQPLVNRDKLILKLSEDYGKFYLFNAEPIATVALPLKPASEATTVNFPEQFRIFDDFIAVVSIEGLYPNGSENWYNKALLVIKPKENLVLTLPQDWYNKADDIDFGYQWLSRATIDPKSKNIRGQGMRMDDFELDDTGRQLKQ